MLPIKINIKTFIIGLVLEWSYFLLNEKNAPFNCSTQNIYAGLLKEIGYFIMRIAGKTALRFQMLRPQFSGV